MGIVSKSKYSMHVSVTKHQFILHIDIFNTSSLPVIFYTSGPIWAAFRKSSLEMQMWIWQKRGLNHAFIKSEFQMQKKSNFFPATFFVLFAGSKKNCLHFPLAMPQGNQDVWIFTSSFIATYDLKNWIIQFKKMNSNSFETFLTWHVFTSHHSIFKIFSLSSEKIIAWTITSS